MLPLQRYTRSWSLLYPEPFEQGNRVPEGRPPGVHPTSAGGRAGGGGSTSGLACFTGGGFLIPPNFLPKSSSPPSPLISALSVTVHQGLRCICVIGSGNATGSECLQGPPLCSNQWVPSLHSSPLQRHPKYDSTSPVPHLLHPQNVGQTVMIPFQLFLYFNQLLRLWAFSSL